MENDKQGKFEIDFFELGFLAETCVPPQTIARNTFWESLSEVHYHRMDPLFRARFYQWLKPKLDMTNEDCRHFEARYNPNNQYRVTAIYEGDAKEYECYKYKDWYHISRTSSIVPDYVTNIEQIDPVKL